MHTTKSCSGARTKRSNAHRSTRTCPQTRNGLLFLISAARRQLRARSHRGPVPKCNVLTSRSTPTLCGAITRLRRALADAAQEHAARQGTSSNDLVGLLLSRESASLTAIRRHCRWPRPHKEKRNAPTDVEALPF